MEEISELNVHCFDGEFYADTRAYLEKHGCTWREKRGGEGELLSVHLTFPPGTRYRELPPIGEFNRYQITFTSGGLMNWTVQRKASLNGMSVPYVYL